MPSPKQLGSFRVLATPASAIVRSRLLSPYYCLGYTPLLSLHYSLSVSCRFGLLRSCMETKLEICTIALLTIWLNLCWMTLIGRYLYLYCFVLMSLVGFTELLHYIIFKFTVLVL